MVSFRYFRDGRFYQGEYYFLLLTSFLGCLLMPSSRDLLMLFISLELVSAPGFLLAAFRKSDPRSNEAGMKFFLIGVLSTAVMLYGMSLIYGITGSLNLSEIGRVLAGPLPQGRETLALASILFVVAGFAFKVSAVPFQFWAPDTYEGAPVPVAAFLATASKAAGFAGLLQLMFVAFPAQYEFWTPIFAVLSILTMTIGNLVALQQRQVVRLLAYSSIAQAGYMLLPFALVSANPAINQDAFAAAVLYILIYAVMTLGAFAVVIAMSSESRGLLITDFAGLSRRAPVIAVAMTVVHGVPRRASRPSAGFWAKFLIFQVAIERGGIGTALAIVMVINSVVSLSYYLAVPKQMLFVDGEHERPLDASRPGHGGRGPRRRSRSWRWGSGPSCWHISRRCLPWSGSRSRPGGPPNPNPRLVESHPDKEVPLIGLNRVEDLDPDRRPGRPVRADRRRDRGPAGAWSSPSASPWSSTSRCTGSPTRSRSRPRVPSR